MKHSFQIITISIIAVLTVVLCGQIYWLHGLYQSIRQETYATLTSAMEMADFNEISARIKSTNRKDKKHAWKSKHLAFNYDFDIYFQSPLKLMRLVDGGIHNILDPLVPIDFKEFCRLFQRECKAKGINIDVYEVMFYGKNGHGQYYTPPGMKMVDAGLVKYHNVEGDYTYEVFVTPLTDIYLHRMRGIILTTILIIVFLAFAFWYLIRTIISLRSIEEMKDDFTNNMTHELKTPIAVTYSAVDAMLNFRARAKTKEKRVNNILKICEEQLKRLSGLVEKILSMSMERRKTLAMNKEDVELRPMIENMAKEFQLKNDKKMTFIIDISPEDMTIHADPMHISNAISNIIDNSIKYSGAEVEIRVKAFRQTDHDIIVLSDNGIGISEENQKRIFDKFYRVGHGNRYNVSGYGLGLYYVRQIIQRHEGSIDCGEYDE
jgi:signal transduction histidine kinase